MKEVMGIAYKTFQEFIDIPIWVGMGEEKQDYVVEN